MVAKEQTKKFNGTTEDAATQAALKWAGDLDRHGSVKIDSVVAKARGERWIATITYRED
jgi:hypothetical protein